MTAVRLWGPVAACMAGLFYLSSLNQVPGDVNRVVPDTLLHAGAYAVLALLVLRALSRERWAGVTPWTLAGAWLIATAYGVTDEWHQMFVPGRLAEARDVANDAIGALVAMGVAGAWGIMRGPSRVQ